MTGTEKNAVKAVESNSDGEDQMPDFLDDPAYMCSASRRMMMKEVIKTLPGNVQHKINALKHLQKKYLSLEAKFFEEVYALECKYQALYQPLVDRRKAVIAGETELEAGEADWEDESDDEKEIDAEVTERFKRMALNYKNQHSKVIKESQGIPAFWLTVFKNTQTMADMIQPHDEPLLEHLTNVNIVYKTDPMSYVLEFHFSPNAYFKDAILTKTYFMRCQVDEEEPFSFEGPEIYKCTGCTIQWNPSKNVTVKTVKKQQKHKQRGVIRTLTKTLPNDSFFNFFSPPQVQDDDKNVDDETQMLLASDFEIGHFLRARIIPKAILYYTGEVMDEDDDGEEEEEEEEEEDLEDMEEEEGEEEEEEEEERPAPKSRKGGRGGGGKKPKDGQNPAECQQQ
ncbi:AAEL005567-PA [Aedes aegypti]|uniref:AAEL005567-PA n=2 Tax=Aedes aegypti TaxID=7159 RepID=Q179P2_AEDAE|nr:nucleosome assembly protein 1-like 4 [Aedes aegypti]XP_001651087.1 nucleosome assembly protein 1-like 4 [Aedes aegypti]ABF18305.1 nucleosome assembly protein NAP-17 [Aedes aegypti]EAT42915.1 AAEL005567-PB [Aedes aegypti]EAT42916.1 AAEL005567-PA [Aedes aegypti]